jgi:hypothetical protein
MPDAEAAEDDHHVSKPAVLGEDYQGKEPAYVCMCVCLSLIMRKLEEYRVVREQLRRGHPASSLVTFTCARHG